MNESSSALKLLLTNDDGIDAPGLAALHESVAAVRALPGWEDVEVVVIAPDRGRSECSHSVTSGIALQLLPVASGWFSLDGTPVDCVRAGLATIAGDVDAVISGVNAGANLGLDLMVSGTFAAAREAACQGLPAMAISQYRRPDVPKTWNHVPAWTRDVLIEFLSRVAAFKSTRASVGDAPPLWNVNLPAIAPDGPVPTCVCCPVDRCPIDRRGVLTNNQIHFELDFHSRPRVAGTDVDLCFAGQVTVSRIDIGVW